jgi:hypothetical protein
LREWTHGIRCSPYGISERSPQAVAESTSPSSSWPCYLRDSVVRSSRCRTRPTDTAVLATPGSTTSAARSPSAPVSRDDFWLQMREGPLHASPDFEAAPVTSAALTRDGRTWRNDRGRGWHATDQSPGIGLDVATVALLPNLLRESTELALGAQRTLRVTQPTSCAPPARWPTCRALLATSGADFTELTEPQKFALDGEGRLIEVAAVVRNTN